jgi:hypothetical protein
VIGYRYRRNYGTLAIIFLLPFDLSLPLVYYSYRIHHRYHHHQN